MNASRTQCPVCAGTGHPGVVGTQKVVFGPRKVFAVPAPTMTPLVDSVGGTPYVGTGLRQRRARPASGSFCVDHAGQARQLAENGATLPDAVRQLVRPR